MFTLNNIRKTSDLSSYMVDSHPCPTCMEVKTTIVTPSQLYSYNSGAMAQDVLHHLPNDERERFISGFCPTCWDSMFSFDEDDS